MVAATYSSCATLRRLLFLLSIDVNHRCRPDGITTLPKMIDAKMARSPSKICLAYLRRLPNSVSM
jgi:hypothetical protein